MILRCRHDFRFGQKEVLRTATSKVELAGNWFLVGVDIRGLLQSSSHGKFFQTIKYFVR